ncbi:MAG: sulfur carrier protein ThiS [Aliivibrio sp.]|uniref:sulfur carrier protein ThiS n=1 Tax=Aliivibrio sp. TaxID=1872443 RepID=UPI001A5E6E9B|nr:sulfur carrier protein ThiS [Aliivibrio sp.]
MDIWMNDKCITIDKSYNLLQALESLELPLNAAAVAVNAVIIPKSNWNITSLNEGDKISMFQAIAGG